MSTSIYGRSKTNYLLDIFENNVQHAIEVLDLYKKLIPSQKEKLYHCFNSRKKDEFYMITRQIMTSFKMIGLPELSEQLYTFAARFKSKSLTDEQDEELLDLLSKIDTTIPFVETELSILKDILNGS